MCIIFLAYGSAHFSVQDWGALDMDVIRIFFASLLIIFYTITLCDFRPLPLPKLEPVGTLKEKTVCVIVFHIVFHKISIHEIGIDELEFPFL